MLSSLWHMRFIIHCHPNILMEPMNLLLNKSKASKLRNLNNFKTWEHFQNCTRVKNAFNSIGKFCLNFVTMLLFFKLETFERNHFKKDTRTSPRYAAQQLRVKKEGNKYQLRFVLIVLQLSLQVYQSNPSLMRDNLSNEDKVFNYSIMPPGYLWVGVI